MALAFWRRRQSSADAPAPRDARNPRPLPDDDPARNAAATLRARARRRLIGAAALLLLAVVVVPMLLDPEPTPVPDNIPIDIPSDKSKFSPRLSLPPVPAPESVPVAPPPDLPPPADRAAEKAPEKSADKAASVTPSSPAVPPAQPPQKTAPRAATEEEKARAALEGKSAEKVVVASKAGSFAVQAAATSTEAGARDLAARLKKAGITSYTERVETAEGVRWRVRVGPFSSRDEAERMRGRLKSQGINGNIVSP